MRFRCPCCRRQIMPLEESFEQDPETGTAYPENTGQFISIAVGRGNTDETTAEMQEVIIDDGERFSVKDETFSEISAHTGILPSALQLLILSWLQPMDNKANTKLFGSAKAVKREQTRHKAAGWIIHPCSAFRLYWNMLMMLLLVVNMYALPVAITFFTDALPLSWIILNILSDVFFMTDLIINFRTGIMVTDMSYKFILEPKKIAVRYLRTWFLVDLISSLPLDYIISAITRHKDSELVGASRALRVLRLAKLLSLLRLLRVSRLVRYVSQYEVIFNWTKSFIKFINLIAVMSLVTHWNACLQYLVPSLTDFDSSSWVEIHHLQNEQWSTKYVWSLFKAMSHMLCIGYGRFPPQNIQEVVVTCFSMATGATCYGIFIAYCISTIQQTDSSRRQYYERVQQIAEYMSYRKLPTTIREKVLKYFDHRYKGKFFDERAILGEVSSPLRNEIISHNCSDLVSAVPFFSEADPVFVSAIITKLRFEVFLEGDIIIREGTIGTEMYFLREGSVEIRTNDDLQNVLNDGSYFGEICLLTNARRIASVIATSTCDTFVLSTSDFHEVLEDFPEMREKMEKVAEERLNFIKRQRNRRASMHPQPNGTPATANHPEV
ncbi:potassium/sodium hyperpolarization-activated cyclic nucleotide-gated channel 2-like [Dendronephthya gigantea]|uniref:potassium/sodium hyperpolarization-activated cyclic nucleotide-gated channel 2-like n=1 Tax=Dendronephthya gigantea TaxID=151771 RepID=UPI00106A3FDC|nr:potassium/sodium hyperpolarization-activated cyclic nucleotide-gated channel 2-like [Dendronephthya gigantea]